MNESPFLSRFVYEDLSAQYGKFTIRLTEDLIYKDVNLGLITVPNGFVSDLASIPQCVQSIVSKVGPYDGAAAIHDWLYSIQTTSKSEADHIFLRVMKASSVKFLLRQTIFWAVRLFAKKAWDDSTPNVEEYRRTMK